MPNSEDRPAPGGHVGRGRGGQHRPGGRRGGRGVLSRGRLQHAPVCDGHMDTGHCTEQRPHAFLGLSFIA